MTGARKRIVNRKLLDSFYNKTCLACGNPNGVVAHHVKTKKSGGDDVEENLMALDYKCHSMVHNIGLTEFSEIYISVKKWLISNGWVFDENSRKWKRFNN